MNSKNSYSKDQINRRLALLCGVNPQLLFWWDEYQWKMARWQTYTTRCNEADELMVELHILNEQLDGFAPADYYNDLNRMFEAEKALWHLSTKLFDAYIRAIYTAVDAKTTNGEVGLEVLDPFDVTTVLWRHADAPTRAEAMYTTLVNQPTE